MCGVDDFLFCKTQFAAMSYVLVVFGGELASYRWCLFEFCGDVDGEVWNMSLLVTLSALWIFIVLVELTMECGSLEDAVPI